MLSFSAFALALSFLAILGWLATKSTLPPSVAALLAVATLVSLAVSFVTWTLLGLLQKATLVTEELDSMLQQIANLWNQIAEVTIIARPEVLRTLVKDIPSAVIAVDLCSEICSNAIRHGNASVVDIELKTDNSGITVTMPDDGIQPTEGTNLGLGRRFLDSCSIIWSNTRVKSKNELKILLPGKVAPSN